MSDVYDRSSQGAVEPVTPASNDFGVIANDLCEKALNDAKEQLHPLLREVDLDRLEKRTEFVQGFKSALEKRIARKLAAWQPGVEAVFKFDETLAENRETWDGSLHLLVKVPHLSKAIKTLSKKLDQSLLWYLKQLGWSRFQTRQSILEIQQVTANELRHGVSYGAMFAAVYNVPVKIWPPKRRAR
jgi:hypothetical protein